MPAPRLPPQFPAVPVDVVGVHVVPHVLDTDGDVGMEPGGDALGDVEGVDHRIDAGLARQQGACLGVELAQGRVLFDGGVGLVLLALAVLDRRGVVGEREAADALEGEPAAPVEAQAQDGVEGALALDLDVAEVGVLLRVLVDDLFGLQQRGVEVQEAEGEADLDGALVDPRLPGQHVLVHLELAGRRGAVALKPEGGIAGLLLRLLLGRVLRLVLGNGGDRQAQHGHDHQGRQRFERH